jgi:hypothetical protein
MQVRERTQAVFADEKQVHQLAVVGHQRVVAGHSHRSAIPALVADVERQRWGPVTIRH